MLVFAVLNCVFTFYFINRERHREMVELQATMEENDALLKVVAAGPLYDGNVEQLDAILDSIFDHKDIVLIELTEYNGNIKLFRTRSPESKHAKSFTRRVVITRGIDQLGEIHTIYSTARIDQLFIASVKRSFYFALLMLLMLSGVIYLVARDITGPIERLTKSACDMASGDLEREISATGAKELRSLGRSFTKMRDAVREKMRELAAQNQTLLRTQFSIDRARDAIFWVRRDGRFVYVNHAACDSLCYTREELLSLSVFDIDPYHPRERWKARWEETRNLGSAILETVHRAKGGRVFPVELSIDFMSFAGEEYLCAFARDVAERKRASAEQQKLVSIIETSSDLIGIADLEGRLLYLNVAGQKLVGLDSFEEVCNKSVSELHLATDYLTVEKVILPSVLQSGNWMGEVSFRHFRTGDEIPVEMNAFLIRDRGTGQPIAMANISRDIRERKRAEDERAQLESQLLQAQKMESVGRLAGGVAHDFNNMLTVILGYAELIMSRLPEGDPLSEDMEEIHKAAIRSKDITRQLLAFSRQQIIEPKPVQLNDLLTEMQNTLGRLIGEDVHLSVYPGNDLWIISVDPSQIDQILINLAVNARDAMPDGGNLTIETANVHVDEASCRDYAGFTSGDYVQLTVSDSGVGMDSETLSHVFEPFFTTKDVDKGTGLGLATVYGIVRQNKGFINVYSERGEGTTFRISFPRAPIKEAEITEKHHATEAAPATGTVLLVEDDDMVRSVATALLQELGYTVLVESNPMDALSLLQRTDTAVDLLLTDVVMPGMKGTELRDRARLARPTLKVLFMSGYTANAIVHHGVLEEGVHFVQKPLNLDNLAKKVNDAIQG
ncbi:MAG TPA: PAS domain S-box protein [Thermodesulfovibrionales bacterium]|nr:PAS domain S-box protein [Thermodesulfovibrionales bacterium]